MSRCQRSMAHALPPRATARPEFSCRWIALLVTPRHHHHPLLLHTSQSFRGLASRRLQPQQPVPTSHTPCLFPTSHSYYLTSPTMRRRLTGKVRVNHIIAAKAVAAVNNDSFHASKHVRCPVILCNAGYLSPPTAVTVPCAHPVTCMLPLCVGAPQRVATIY